MVALLLKSLISDNCSLLLVKNNESLTINGRDISEANHEQVVEAFRTASNPILVEIVPRKSSANSQTSHMSQLQNGNENGEHFASIQSKLCEISTQTEWTGGWENIPFLSPMSPFSLWSYLSIPPPPPTTPKASTEDSDSPVMNSPQMASLLAATANGIEMNQFLGNHSFLEFDETEENEGEVEAELVTDTEEEEDEEDEDECDAIEYEEVTLNKESEASKLGVNVAELVVNACNVDEMQQSPCCDLNEPQGTATSSGQEMNGNTGNETHCSREVYVNKLETDGIALKDGKIKVGDQILEINGLEVKSAEEAQALLETSDTLEFKIFVARTNPKHNHLKCRERAQQKRLQPFFKWCDDSHRNHVSLIDDSYDYCEMLLGVNDDDKEDVKHTSSNNVDTDAMAKDEKDSGVGKTDGDSTCTRTNDTCSTDYELTLEKVSAVSAKNGGFASAEHSDASLDREMSLLQQEMANIQLECERLINRHVEQKQLIASQKEAVISPPTTPVSQKCELDTSQRQCDQTKLVSSVADISTANKTPVLPLQVSSLRKGPTPPPTPKHYPKPKQFIDKPKPPAKKPVSKATDHLPEMQPMEKKESIKRWIKSGIPTTPPSSRRTSSKLGICRSVEFSDKNLCDGERDQRDGFTLQLSPVKANDSVINQYRSGSMLSLLPHRKDSVVDEYVFTEDKGTQMQESDVASLFSCESCKRCCRALIDSKGKNVVFPANNRCTTPGCNIFEKGQIRGQRIDNTIASEFSSRNKYEENRNNYVQFYPPFSATMYTNKANLEHTILLQQQLLRQALFRQQKTKAQRNRQLINSSSHQMSSFPDIVSSNRRDSTLLSPVGSGNPYNAVPPSPSKSAPITTHNLRKGVEMRTIDISNENVCNLNVEWKVKKRSDGSRYITRRPVRNKLLKERAMRIMQERSGLTTDDDAMSELKIGKYWTKDERKKQVEKAKDRKRKEMMLRAIKMGALREQSEEREVICFDATMGNVSSGSGNSIAKNKSHFKNATLGSSGSSKGGGSGGHPNQFATTSNIPSKNRLNELLTVTTV